MPVRHHTTVLIKVPVLAEPRFIDLGTPALYVQCVVRRLYHDSVRPLDVHASIGLRDEDAQVQAFAVLSVETAEDDRGGWRRTSTV
jgi:hypothetical protein